MNRIDELFKRKNKNILSIFYTAGFPALSDTLVIAQELERAGVDLIEIGIPFSDPVADGPVIQESNKIALENGMTLKLLLKQVAEIRATVKLPIILMGYLNPVMQFGVERFCKEASLAGVDGVILPDLPLSEYETEYKRYFEQNNLRSIFLISPTTSEARIQEVDAASSGFIYAVSASSTTGSKNNFSEEQIEYFKKLQGLKLKNPLIIGFGISGKDSFNEACKYGTGAIVGSAFIDSVRNSKQLSLTIRDFVNDIRG